MVRCVDSSGLIFINARFSPPIYVRAQKFTQRRINLGVRNEMFCIFVWRSGGKLVERWELDEQWRAAKIGLRASFRMCAGEGGGVRETAEIYATKMERARGAVN